MKHVSIACALTILVVAGCGPVQRQAAFDEREYAPYRDSAGSSVAGQAFLKTRGGDVKYAAGNHVFITPVTSYSTEYWNRRIVNGEKLSPPDPRAAEFKKTAIADGEGRFVFENLASGDYYVFCEINWEVPAGYFMATTGGIVGAKVHLDAGQQAKVVLEPVRGG